MTRYFSRNAQGQRTRNSGKIEKDVGIVLIATSKMHLCRYLQPHLVLQVSHDCATDERKIEVVAKLNPHPLQRPEVKLLIPSSVLNNSCAAENNCARKSSMQPSKVIIKTEVTNRSFHSDHEKPTAVLYSKVLKLDHMTSSLDALFDLPFDGTATSQVPAFPSRAELGNSCGCFRIGVIHGPSGTSKSVLSAFHFGGNTLVEWNPELAIYDHLMQESRDNALDCACLPREFWQRKFHTLSAGYDYRSA